MKRAVVLAEGAFGELGGKTGNVAVMYSGKKIKTVAVIDSRYAGRDAGEVLGEGHLGIPIVSSFKESLAFKPEVVIIGVATVGGYLPKQFRPIVSEALKQGMEVWSGLHHFLSEDLEFREIAEKYGGKIVDFRKPPKNLKIWSGEILKTKNARVLIAGTDCVVGKNIALIELSKELSKRSFFEGTVGTGQTVLMTWADAGYVIDAIAGDFGPGMVEESVVKLRDEGRNPILVEGQASLLHPAYAPVSLAIAYGSIPDAIVISHDPWRILRADFEVPIDSLKREIIAIEHHLNMLSPHSKVVAISVMGYRRSKDEVEQISQRLEREFGIPTADVKRDPGKIADAVLQHLSKIKKL